MSCHQPIYGLTHFLSQFLLFTRGHKRFLIIWLHDNYSVAPTSLWNIFCLNSSFPLVLIFPQSPVTRLCMTRLPWSSELLRDLRFVQCSPKYYYCGSAPVRPGSPLNVVIIQMRFRATNANTNQPQTNPTLILFYGECLC